jgi:uracil-DNA glycosylase family 4
MFSIKNSFTNCSVCSLLDAPSCILETNCEDDLTKVDIVFVAENPGKEEVEKEKPLVGKAGKLFRKYFRKFHLDQLNYMITNVVLCQTLNEDGTTGNPEPDVIQMCKVNCMEIIKFCNPKLIVLMGTSPMSAFGLGKSGITERHGQMYKWEDRDVFITVHPSFVNRNLASWEPKYEQDMATVAEIMSGQKVAIENKSAAKIKGKGMFRYQIPDKFYTDEYRLIDIQYIQKTNEVLYIFRDKENNKVYHKEHDDYVFYQVPKGIKAKKIMPYDELDQVVIKYKDRSQIDHDISYEGDVRLTTKHAMDYYYFNKSEAPRVKNNIMYCDIEVDTGKLRVFPNQKDAKFPINMITTILNGEKVTYVIDNKTEPIKKIEGVNIKVYKDERALINAFIDDFKTKDPDFICGWNFINFDMDYIYNRLHNIKIPPEKFSKFGEFYVDGSKFICHLLGCVVLDQEFLYKTFTFTKMENYKLGFITQHELKVTKIQLPLPMNEMYWKMLNKTIEYNIRDAELLEKLENKLGHINLMNEIRVVCNSAFEAGSGSFGQIDSLMVSFMREKGLACHDSDPNITKDKYPGAYVFEPNPGVYDWITDFDFASLYPSLMITYNIGVSSYVMKLKDPHLGYELAYFPDKLPEKVKVIIDPLHDKVEMDVTPTQLLEKIKNENLVHTINGCFFTAHKKNLSEFGQVVDELMIKRKVYKTKMLEAIGAKDKEQENFYYTRQLVYKVLANTLYGVVANKAFRFFDLSLAGAITISGQEALKTAIIEGDAFMRSLNTGKPYVPPKPLTKEEMFADPDENPELYRLPDRSHDYIVTGDTDSIFCCFEKLKINNVDEILKICKQVEEFLNKDKIVEVVKKHNSDLDFNRLALKNELVISRGLFLAKKRYAIRVVNQEGKTKDAINYMGVEIKRSDYPSKSKEFLAELCELVLKSDKIAPLKIASYIKQKEKEFMTLVKAGDKRVARPVSYGKKLEDYKTLSQAVKAMEAWNKIMYDIHKTGAKAYMYWVKGIDPEKAPQDVVERYEKFVREGNKLEVIAIPDEEERLPEFFNIDMKASMKFVFTDRHELMLKPLFDVKKDQVVMSI